MSRKGLIYITTIFLIVAILYVLGVCKIPQVDVPPLPLKEDCTLVTPTVDSTLLENIDKVLNTADVKLHKRKVEKQNTDHSIQQLKETIEKETLEVERLRQAVSQQDSVVQAIKQDKKKLKTILIKTYSNYDSSISRYKHKTIELEQKIIHLQDSLSQVNSIVRNTRRFKKNIK